jgi:hypothetical protein
MVKEKGVQQTKNRLEAINQRAAKKLLMQAIQQEIFELELELEELRETVG